MGKKRVVDEKGGMLKTGIGGKIFKKSKCIRVKLRIDLFNEKF